MKLKDFINTIQEYAELVGFKKDTNGIWRNNTESSSIVFENDAYCGFIRPGQESSGSYADFSLCFMPERKEDNQDEVSACVITLIIGTEKFLYDGQLAQLPSTRRLFLNLNTNSSVYYKTDFSNYNDKLPELSRILDNHPHLRQFEGKYGPLVVAFEVVDQIDDFKINSIPLEFKKWICTYAKLRGWTTTKNQRNEVGEVLSDLDTKNAQKQLNEKDIYDILIKDRFVILQGAPGTGKTFTTLNIADKFDMVKFTQFHAETTYSDFVYGIRPTTKDEKLFYIDNPGKLYEAIKSAIENQEKKVLLIIDEINRANLSNVLGPVFYLFEKNTGDNRKYNVNIGDLKIDRLPENLYVIGTMNTADKSLAIVDFALRRRFTWITLRPKVLDLENFHKQYFNDFQQIFMRHATDEELNLQPGQSYFIAEKDNNDKAIKHRLKYELMPLIKEYINEGFLLSAKDEFVNYFYNTIGELMYE